MGRGGKEVVSEGETEVGVGRVRGRQTEDRHELKIVCFRM